MTSPSVTAYLALGGNLGDVLATFRRALAALPAGGARVGAVSTAYRTRAMMPDPEKEQGPDFWNAAASVETRLGARELLALMLEIEKGAGRERGERWAERPLDLDILLYGDAVIDEPGLTVPHPGLAERPFVLNPLAEIAGPVVVPSIGFTVGQLLEQLPDRWAGVEYTLRNWHVPMRAGVS